MSILDETQLNKDNFEGAIGVGMTPKKIFTLFNVTGKEMDEWCTKEYGHNFATTFEMVKQAAHLQFMTTVKTLGYRGNPSALNIINAAINEASADQVVAIKFVNNVALESEEDKEDGD